MLARYPLVGFFALAYLITWTFHILAIAVANESSYDLDNQANYNILSGLFSGDSTGQQRFGLLVFNIGQFGPLLAAFIMTALLYGRAGIRDLAGRMVHWRVGARWYLFILLLPLVFAAVALLIALITGGFSLGPFEPGVAWAHFFGFFLYMVVFNGIAEEPGWRPTLIGPCSKSRLGTSIGFERGSLLDPAQGAIAMTTYTGGLLNHRPLE